MCYLWRLKSARIRVQGQQLVEFEQGYEAKSKLSNQRAQLMCVLPHNSSSDFKIIKKRDWLFIVLHEGTKARVGIPLAVILALNIL